MDAPTPETLAARQEIARLHVELLRARDRIEELESTLARPYPRDLELPPAVFRAMVGDVTVTCRTCGQPQCRADAGHAEPRGPH